MATEPTDYREAGVDRALAAEALARIGPIVRTTHTPGVIDLPNGFAGLFALRGERETWTDPVLVAAADGVGTKLKLARETRHFEAIGHDLVAMNVNDIIVHGAKPLFFLDYIATASLSPHRFEALIRGMADGCREARCALLGGETAQMPGLYHGDDFDLAGFAVGIVERSRILDGRRIEPGDLLLGLPSSGPHANGFSLIRHVLQETGTDLEQRLPGTDTRLIDALMTPTRIYVDAISFLLKAFEPETEVSGLCHVTGGGLPGNLVRILPEGCRLLVRRGSWEVPPLFAFVQELGRIPDEEMARTFNLGIGFCILVKPQVVDLVARVMAYAAGEIRVIGEVVEGVRDVAFV